MVWALSRSLRRPLHQTISHLPLRVSTVLRHTIDYSLVPKVKEYEVEEKFVRGSGPGGSAVNKNSNCVVLTHKPTGIVIKCHQSRSLDENRKTAREQLAHKLDDIENKEQSVNAQKSRIQQKKHKSSEYKRQKMHRLKSEWMEREGLK